MKKFVSIALAIVMVLSVSVSAFAVEIDDEYVASVASEGLSSFTVLFPVINEWWDSSGAAFVSTDSDGVAFVEAIQTEGAYVVIKADAGVASGEEGDGYQYALQITSGDWTFVHISSLYPDEGDIGAEYVTVDGDYAYIFVNAADLIEAGISSKGIDITSDGWQWINGASYGYKTYGVYVIIPASSESTEETTEEVSSEASETEETTESSESSETSTASSPDTGVALALVPMAIAGIAVVSSKIR